MLLYPWKSYSNDKVQLEAVFFDAVSSIKALKHDFSELDFLSPKSCWVFVLFFYDIVLQYCKLYWFFQTPTGINKTDMHTTQTSIKLHFQNLQEKRTHIHTKKLKIKTRNNNMEYFKWGDLTNTDQKQNKKHTNFWRLKQHLSEWEKKIKTEEPE